jgi:hypothetical protein
LIAALPAALVALPIGGAADSPEGLRAWRLTLATLPVAADITPRSDVMAEGDDSWLEERHVSARSNFVDTSKKRGDIADMSPHTPD